MTYFCPNSALELFRNRLQLLRGFAPQQDSDALYPDVGFTLRPLQPPLHLFRSAAPEPRPQIQNIALEKAFLTPTAFGAPLRWTRSNFAEIFGIRKLESLGYRVELFA